MTARLLPGTGSFDLERFIRTLDASGCTAPLAVEIFFRELADQPMADSIRDWARAARAILERARKDRCGHAVSG